MASINGFEVKAIKEFRGHDGGGYYQCNIYHNGKKVAEYADDAWGGEPYCEFKNADEEKEIWKAMIPYYEAKQDKFFIDLYTERPEQFAEEKENFLKYHPYIKADAITKASLAADIGCFVSDLMQLKDLESRYKKAVKKGYPTLIEVSNGFQCYSLMTKITKNVAEVFADNIENMKSKLSEYKGKTVTIITKLEDLNYRY